MNHNPPREVILGTPTQPITLYIFSEGNRGWLEKSIEEPYKGTSAIVVK